MKPIDPPYGEARGSRQQIALHELRELIRSGQLEPGMLTSESELAQRLGVSRTPIGRAIAILVREGLMESAPQVGVRVRKITPEEIDEIFAIRIALETVIVRALAGKSKETNLLPLRENIRRTEISTDAASFLADSTSFHFICARLAGFAHGAMVLESLRDKLQTVGVRVTNAAERREQIILEHKEIVSAVEAGDPDLAAQRVVDHLQASEHRMRLVSKYLT